jgi:hypothetical protein
MRLFLVALAVVLTTACSDNSSLLAPESTPEPTPDLTRWEVTLEAPLYFNDHVGVVIEEDILRPKFLETPVFDGPAIFILEDGESLFAGYGYSFFPLEGSMFFALWTELQFSSTALQMRRLWEQYREVEETREGFQTLFAESGSQMVREPEAFFFSKSRWVEGRESSYALGLLLLEVTCIAEGRAVIGGSYLNMEGAEGSEPRYATPPPFILTCRRA